jgi:hypothetical protein
MEEPSPGSVSVTLSTKRCGLVKDAESDCSDWGKKQVLNVPFFL